MTAPGVPISPILSCWLFIELFLWLLVSWSGWGFDSAWQWVFILLMPSSADMAFVKKVAREHPGQLLVAIGGIVLGGFIAWMVISQIPETWQVVAGVVVVFGPGWLLSTLYAKIKG